MKEYSYKNFWIVVGAIALVLGVVVWKVHVEKPRSTFSQQAAPHHQLSVFSQQQHSQDNKRLGSDSLQYSPARITPQLPSPLDHPSKEEIKRFPGAMVIEFLEEEGPSPGQKTRLRLLKTHFKYPLIRTEEIIDPAKSGVVSRQEMVASHLLVTLPEGESSDSFLKKLDPQGEKGFSMIRVTPDAPLYRLNIASPSLSSLSEILDHPLLKQDKKVIVEPDFICQTLQAPNNPYYKYQWGLWKSRWDFNFSAQAWSFYAGINAEEAWKVRTDASSVIVAIVDSGIRYTHEALAPNMWHNPSPSKEGDIYGWNAHDNNGDPMDNNGHGTHCAGVIGAVGNSGLGVVGVAWKVQLMACKMFDGEGQGTDSDGAICMDYARDHGAKIINCSWGHGTACSISLKQAVERAREAGVMVVCAAGNESSNNDENPFYPASCKSDNILSVAATAFNDDLVVFDTKSKKASASNETGSNYGAHSVHLAAPGSLIISSWATDDHSYFAGSGTSCAAPYVSGALALLAAEYPMESYSTLLNHLLETTDRSPKLADKVMTGRLNVGSALTSKIIRDQ